MTTEGATDWAEVAFEIWQPSKDISDALRDLIPTAHDFLGEIRRYQAPGVELMPNAHKGNRLYLAADPERGYAREKFYVRVFLEREVVEARDVDMVRRACFEGARLTGQHIAFRVMDALEAMRPPAGASADYTSAQADWRRTPMTVRFTGEPMRLIDREPREGGLFACFDSCTDRVAFHFASYFTVAPAGEAVSND